MAAKFKHLLLAAVLLAVAGSSLCFHAGIYLDCFGRKPWIGERRRNVCLGEQYAKREGGRLAVGRLDAGVKSGQETEIAKHLENLAVIHKREQLRNPLAERIITPEVFAHLQRGWCVIDDVISPDLAARALVGAETLRRDGFMYRLKDEYSPGRQDDIMPIEHIWKPEWGPVPAEFQGLDEVCNMLKGMAGAIARHAQPNDELSWLCPPNYMQLACFASQGRGYVRHLDNPAHGDPHNPQFHEGVVGSRVADRRVTALVYLNQNWRDEDGGLLRLFDPTPGREDHVLAAVHPQAGRVVLFDSVRYFHEVMPAFRERWALSAWMTIPPVHPAHPLHLTVGDPSAPTPPPAA